MLIEMFSEATEIATDNNAEEQVVQSPRETSRRITPAEANGLQCVLPRDSMCPYMFAQNNKAFFSLGKD